MSSTIMSAIGDVDYMMDKARGLIAFASKHDPELASGAATGGEMPLVEKKINEAMGAAEEVDSFLRELSK